MASKARGILGYLPDLVENPIWRCKGTPGANKVFQWEDLEFKFCCQKHFLDKHSAVLGGKRLHRVGEWSLLAIHAHPGFISTCLQSWFPASQP